MEPQKPVTVEVLAYAPTVFFHCQHCEVVWHELDLSQGFHREQLDSSLPDDLRKQYEQLSDWVREMAQTHGQRIVFRIIDAASLEGWWKSVRYGVHHYPAIVVDRKEKITDSDFVRASALIQQKMAQAQAQSSAA